MGTNNTPVAGRLEDKVLRFFSPNGLLTAVFLIILMCFLFSGGGIEHRTLDTSAADHQQMTESPLLYSVR
ncbi:uncharacterized protein Dvar_02890 [Desulfosarcina variabilis str. Montpellier]|jgi:hypothetical protein|uniref:hypothetical protein n=1 Tax=Desulfosarcina variabilis TaxID=2300 RepID=UPI003AFB3CB4